MRQQAYLVKSVRISIIDAREAGKFDDTECFYLRELGLDAPSMSFYFEGGLMSLVRFENEHAIALHRNIFYVQKPGTKDGEMVEIALQYVDDISSRVLPFANNIY